MGTDQRRGGWPVVLCLGIALAFGVHAQEAATPAQDARDLPQAGPEAGDVDGSVVPEEVSVTGDPWLDDRLIDMGRYAERYRDAFIDELVRYGGAARGPLTRLMETPGWDPGDVYFACSLARVTGRSCRLIVDLRRQQPQASWQTLAEGLGAGPGTAPFTRLKRGVVHSYQRWGRPLQLDDELSRAFPDHGAPPPVPPADAGVDGR